jgi:hypothetical protein
MKKRVYREKYYGKAEEETTEVIKISEEVKEEKPKKKKVKNDDTNSDTDKHD